MIEGESRQGPWMFNNGPKKWVFVSHSPCFPSSSLDIHVGECKFENSEILSIPAHYQ